ncbi:MAG: hypothetical protein ACFFC0_10710 [Promethearchaeota archaeon]
MISRTAQVIGFIIVLVIILGFPPGGMFTVTHVQGGESSLGPGSISRSTVRGSQGDRVVFSYEADFTMVECALIELGEREVDDFTRDTDLHEVWCFYYQVKMHDEVELTMTEDYELLLFVRNFGNISQEFRYEWYSRNASLDLLSYAIMRLAIATPVVLCGISVLFCKKRHEQLLRAQRPEEWDYHDD